ncbi:MAG: N-acetylneuraminate synthase family protein [Bacteroidetes bacterium]|nr:N-acetylneuraminate synthase family protein [Bacteroidota bacterium]
MDKGYTILEVANVHAGDFNYFQDLISQLSEYKKPDYGIKLQVFKADLIALPSFSDYGIYEELLFDWNQWSKIISQAAETKDVWIDIFDLYGAEAVQRFNEMIYGVKFQASVLENYEVISALKETNMKGKYLVLNVAGLEMNEIHQKVNYIKSEIDCKEIILQVGYQNYPTQISKSGIFKIKELETSGYRVIFADHSPGDSEEAILLPLMAYHAGAMGVEKHVMLGDRPTKYDFQASITVNRLKEYTAQLEKYFKGIDTTFVNEVEAYYLAKTIQKPVLNKSISAGKAPTEVDFYYRRTDEDGLMLSEIQALLDQGMVLRKGLLKDSVLRREDFKMPVVALIVACRLKSSRLKSKALLNIGDLPSIQMCMKNALRIPEAHHIVLATSDLESDAALRDHTYDDSVIFHQGDPEDVILRYLDICDKLNVNTVIRLTGDCPYVSQEIASILLKSHRETGADYTAARDFAVGTSTEIIEVEAMREIKRHFGSAEYSEYMTWYFMNNQEHFKTNVVELPEEYVRDYRLTLDYQEDLDLFNKIAEHFASIGKEYTLKGLFEFLDDNPDVAALNGEMVLTYKTDQKLIDTLNEKTKIRS